MSAAVRQARLLCNAYGLQPGQVTESELLWVCEQLEIPVRHSNELSGPGFFVPEPFPAIILRDGAGARILAHELAHALIPEEGREERESQRSYRVRAYRGREWFCEEFALHLCGELTE